MEDLDNYKGSWAPYLWEEKNTEPVELTEAQKAYIAEQAEKKKKEQIAKGEFENWEETTEYHGVGDLLDYQGNSYLKVPSTVKIPPENDPIKCYIPKKAIHTWTGHSKGVNKVLFFPDTAHLLLSASMDCSVKIWNVHGSRKVFFL